VTPHSSKRRCAPAPTWSRRGRIGDTARRCCTTFAANGVEIYRQRVPANAPDLAQLLIDNGADIAAEARMYGGDRAVLGMLLSSSHPSDAGVTGRLARVLRHAGASSD
jgi:hypothetical protein